MFLLLLLVLLMLLRLLGLRQRLRLTLSRAILSLCPHFLCVGVSVCVQVWRVCYCAPFSRTRLTSWVSD